MTPCFSVLALLRSLWLISLTLTFGGESPQGKPLEQTLQWESYSPLQWESFSSHVERNRHRLKWRCEVARQHSVFAFSTFMIRVSLSPIYKWPGHGRSNIDYCWIVDHWKNHRCPFPLPPSFILYRSGIIDQTVSRKSSLSMGLNVKNNPKPF